MHGRSDAGARGLDFLLGGGRMGALMRTHDWLASSLGAPEDWPQPLKTLVGVMLGSKQPMFVAWGPERTLLYNDPYAEVLGNKHPSALDRDVLEVWHEIRAALVPIVEQAYAGEPVHMEDIELVMERKGYPEETHFAFSYTPVRDEAGAVAGFFCPCVDITEQVLAERRRREAEAALRAERDRTRRVLDGMAEGFGLLDREFRVIDINAEGLRLEERPREAILGKTHWEAWPGSEESELGRLYKRAMAERVPVSLEHRYVWADGHEAWIEMRAYPTDDGLALFWRNITERHRHQDALRAERDRSVEILESISDAFYAVDRDWRFTYVNRKAEEWWGRRADDLIGRVYWEEFPQAVGSEAYDAHQRAMREGAPVRVETVSPILGHWVSIDIHPTAGGGLSVYFRDIRDKKQAEEWLRESEARFRLMADAVPQIVWITDPDGRAEFFNKQWSDYTGAAHKPTTAAEVAADYLHPDDAEPTMAAFDEARRTGGTFLVEHRIRSRTGEYRWFLVRGEPYRDPTTGEIVRWFGASIDIDDRRRAEAALRQSEARLRLVQAAGGIGSFDYDLQKDEAVCSPEYYTILGLPDGHPINRETWAAAIHPDDAHRAVEALDRAIQDRKPFDYEYRIVRADNGQVRWLAGRATIIFDADGRPWRYVGVNIDVTDRRTAEERLRELNETLEERVAARTAERNHVWTLTEDMLARANYEGQMSAVNPAWTKVLGWSEQELLTNPYADIIHPEDVGATVAALLSMGETKQPTRFENRILTSTGEWKPIGWTVSPELDGVNFIAVGRDLTEYKAREQQLLEAQEALRQAQKMEAVGQLTGGVAHDFNNLLTIIKASTDFLRRPDLAEERRRRYVDAISDTVDRASKLTGQLLAFARRQALKPEVFDVADRLRSVTEMIRTIVGARIRMETEIACEACYVETDASQFETALINMAVNARDAMDGEGRLTVRVEGVTAMPPLRGHGGSRGRFVAVSLTDTGHGIAADKLVQIFEPFYTTKGVGKGTGLGLSQVYGFAKQSGGDVAVESEVGRGTTFTLYLPQTEAEGATDSTAAPDAAEPAEYGRGRRILVVEDNVEVGRFSTQILEDLGYETTWAANAEEALKLLDEAEDFDAVFSDVVMPGMSGVELGQEIRRRHHGLPVVLTSGYSHVLAEEGRHGFELLHKPYAAEELSRVLGRVIRGRRAGRSRSTTD